MIRIAYINYNYQQKRFKLNIKLLSHKKYTHSYVYKKYTHSYVLHIPMI